MVSLLLWLLLALSSGDVAGNAAWKLLYSVPVPDSTGVAGFALSSGNHLAIQSNSNLYIYNISKTGNTLVNSFAGYQPNGIGNGIVISTNGEIIFVAPSSPTDNVLMFQSFGSDAQIPTVIGDQFGGDATSLACSPNGHTLVIIPSSSTPVFYFQLHQLKASGKWESVNVPFDSSLVALSASVRGDHAAVGFVSGIGQASVVIYSITALFKGQSAVIATLLSPSNSNGFGDFVAFSRDGNFLAVGDDVLPAVYLYTSAYSLVLTVPPPAGFTGFGQGVNLSNRKTIVIGGSTSSQTEFVLFDLAGVVFEGAGQVPSGVGSSGFLPGPSPQISSDGKLVAIPDLDGQKILIYGV